MPFQSTDLYKSKLSRSVIFSFWSLFILFIFVSNYFGLLFDGNERALGKSIFAAYSWIIWIPLTFVIIWLVQRYPLNKDNFGRNGMIQLGAAVVVLSFHEVVLYFLHWLSTLDGSWDWHPKGTALRLLFYSVPLSFMVYGVIVAVVTAFDYYFKYRNSELALAHSQLESLRMQLHPHFLFNTHHSIIALMEEGRIRSAAKMLQRLSDLLRVTLEKTDQQMISLEEEIKAVDMYLGIQKERFRERLKIEKRFEPGSIMAAEVPYLILQPLVENVFKHSIEKRIEGGKLVITGRKIEGDLVLSVKDDGPGISSKDEGKGIGLENIKMRMEKLYGENYSMRIDSVTGEGFEVCLCFPYKEFKSS